MRPVHRTVRAAVASAIVLSAGASVVFAQGGIGSTSRPPAQQAPIRPPDPGNPTAPNLIVVYLLLIALLGASVGLSIMPSQRTHQD